jgi:hypothetical protein
MPVPDSSGVLPDQKKTTVRALPTDLSLLHQTQKKSKMKATTIIIAAILTISMNVLLASNDGAEVNSESRSLLTLAPITPSEAAFEDANDATVIAFNLAPVSPIEADFSDEISETTIDIITLAPVTPIEADFASDDETTNVSVLAPVTPSVADFSDGI